jgi:3-isopropylmalate/(R)-2-methylmalate dehydratase small subunit
LADNVSTDDITSAKYVTSLEPADLAGICLKDLDPEFPARMAGGGFLVAGRNFGCGSSREWAPVALKAAGTRAVLAEGFARLFYRNALNTGLPLVECPGIAQAAAIGDELAIDLATGTVHNRTRELVLQGCPLPRFLLEIVEAGGLAEYLRRHGAAPAERRR